MDANNAATTESQNLAELDGFNKDLLEGFSPMGTPEEASEFLHIHINSIRAMCRSGELPAIKVGKHWRIPKVWLAEFIERSRV